ncbi:MAG: hypothetical protein JNM43_25685 [Planctomycetaceae bacterium]|nr:hypothetical protein [Planctomycetaceae bacterium]
MFNHLDWQQRWRDHSSRLRAIGFLLLGLMLLLVFPFPFHGRLWRALFDLAHGPVFFLTVLLCVFALDPGKLGFRNRSALIPLTIPRFVVLAAGLFFVGVFGELGQALVRRHPSIQDAVANAAGVFAGVLICGAAALRQLWRRLVLYVCGVAILVVPEIGPLRELREHFQQQSQFPLIASFERPEELGAWEPHGATAVRSDDWSTDGRYSLRVRSLNGQIYPGASMVYFPGDWTKFRTVEFSIRNRAEQPMLLGVRIIDRLHEERGYIPDDRFHVDVPLAPGEIRALRWTLEQVKNAPRTRKTNLDDLTQINVFSVEPQDNVDFEIDEIRLYP